MNRVFIIGNLTRDPELNTTNSGVSVCRFTVAVQRRVTNAEGVREADFFNVSAWRGTADNCAKFLKKGSKVSVVGSIQIRNFDRADGSKGTSVEITADEVEFLSPRGEGAEGGVGVAGGSTAQPQASAPVADLQPVDEDLPF